MTLYATIYSQTPPLSPDYSSAPLSPMEISTPFSKEEMVTLKQNDLMKQVDLLAREKMKQPPPKTQSIYIFGFTKEDWNDLCKRVFDKMPITPKEVKKIIETRFILSKKEGLYTALQSIVHNKQIRLDEKSWYEAYEIIFDDKPWISFQKVKKTYEEAMLASQQEKLSQAINWRLWEKGCSEITSLNDCDWQIISQAFDPILTSKGIKDFYFAHMPFYQVISAKKEELYEAVARKLVEKSIGRCSQLEDHDWSALTLQFFGLEIPSSEVQKFYYTNKADKPALKKNIHNRINDAQSWQPPSSSHTLDPKSVGWNQKNLLKLTTILWPYTSKNISIPWELLFVEGTFRSLPFSLDEIKAAFETQLLPTMQKMLPPN